MSGGRGRGGPGGYPGPGYGGAEYGDEGYDTGGTAPASGDPQWDDSVWQRDQPDAWGGQPPGTPPGYNSQGYGGQGYGGQDYDPPGYPAQQYEGQQYEGQAYPDRGVPGAGQQRYPRSGAQPAYPGSAPYPAQPGPGYDPRYQERPGDDSFLPGFGPRDDFEGGRGQDRPGNGGRGRYNGYDDPRAQRGTAADPRRRDPREPAGYPVGEPTGPARPDPRRQQGPRPDGRDPRTGDPQRGGRGNGQGNGIPIGPDDAQPRRRRRSPIRRLAPWIALLVIVIPLALVGWHIYGIWRAKTHPADYVGSGTTPTVTVQVQSGETADQLAPTLLADGVVASTRAFVLAAENSSDPTGLEPGYFILNHHMQASLAWTALLNPKNRDQSVVTIPEGKRATQVIATLAQKMKLPLKDFQQVIDHPAQLGLPSYADGKVEGFLFPATYTIQPHETALQILQAMVARYNLEAQQVNLSAAAQKLHLSERDVIIEASMAQAEGGSVTDYPKIAEVINNRIKAGMPLQFDSVLLYGLNKYAINVTDAQIATPGPYNDFEHDGLPPGPIANPGNAAIEGILRPDVGDWLYFLTVPGGKSEFSHNCLPGQC